MREAVGSLGSHGLLGGAGEVAFGDQGKGGGEAGQAQEGSAGGSEGRNERGRRHGGHLQIEFLGQELRTLYRIFAANTKVIVRKREARGRRKSSLTERRKSPLAGEQAWWASTGEATTGTH
jgi:hypothetical protein